MALQTVHHQAILPRQKLVAIVEVQIAALKAAWATETSLEPRNGTLAAGPLLARRDFTSSAWCAVTQVLIASVLTG